MKICIRSCMHLRRNSIIIAVRNILNEIYVENKIHSSYLLTYLLTYVRS
jgi:hypothetical protein